MELLKNREKIKIEDQELQKLNTKLNTLIKEKQIKFAFQMRWPFLILMIIIDALLAYFSYNFYVIKENQTIGLVFVVITIIFLLSTWIAYWKWTSKANKHNEKQLVKLNQIREVLFQSHFNEKFSDVKISKKLTKKEILNHHIKRLLAVRTNTWMNGRSFDSKVVDLSEGYQLTTENNLLLSFFVIKVRETHERITTDSDGDLTTETYYKYFEYLCAMIDNVLPKWKETVLIVRPGRTRKNGLENEYFNKEWAYSCNDQVKLRMILTPWVQEQILKANFKYAFEHHGVLTFWHGKGRMNWFMQNLKIKKDPRETYQSILRDLKQDLEIFQSLVQDLSVYKLIVN